MTNAIDPSTEAATIAALGSCASVAQVLDPGELYRVPSGALLDLEKFRDTPDRFRGTTALHDPESFIKAVTEFETTRSHVYASLKSVKFVAVFNDASGKGETGAGWGDHTAELTLQHTPEWKHWTTHDGALLSQVQFAEHIEDGLLEIVEPEAAEMLELAQTFHAKTGVDFKSSNILDSGERQFLYEETTTATAGRKGDITVPKEFVLALRPFEGSDVYKVQARLRHRLSADGLKLGYRLTRPHDVIRSAFEDIAKKIGEGVESDVLLGTPATGVGRS